MPIIAESYGGGMFGFVCCFLRNLSLRQFSNYNFPPTEANHGACSYSVAVARKGTGFGLRDLKGKKSCHTGLGTSEGWLLPIGTLLSRDIINWAGGDDVTLQQGRLTSEDSNIS